MERDRPDSQRNVLLIGSDLMARERIRSAAAHLEMKARAAGVSELVGALQQEPADVLVLDLDEGRDEVLESLRSAAKEDLTPNVIIGFYSHVDRDLAAAAQEAGVTPVRRGRFWSNLPGFLSDR